jgi:hypothetical protein
MAVTHPPGTINRAMTLPPRNPSRAPMEENAAHRLAVLGRAPELVGVDQWLNTPDGEPVRLGGAGVMRGHVSGSSSSAAP